LSESTIEQIVTSDGYRHHVRRWVPDERPKGFVLCLHGIQSHSGWYGYSSGKLCEAGYEVIFIDRRGSGLNQPERGHARHHDRLINDVVQALEDLRIRRNEIAPTVPVTLLGLSWGGKLASVVAARRQELIDGLALLYPGIRSRFEASILDNVKLSLAREAELFEKLIPIPLDDPGLFTGQSESQTFIRNDNLSLRNVTVSFLLANRELDKLTQEAPPEIRCPSILMLAGKDQIIDNPATRQWYGSLASQERAFFEYTDACHTLEFEPDREQWIGDLTGWLNDLTLTT
jgi:acylglycerol lipase